MAGDAVLSESGNVSVSERGRRLLLHFLVVALGLSVSVSGLQGPPAFGVIADQPPVGTVVEVTASGSLQRLEDPYLWTQSFSETLRATQTATGLAGSSSGEFTRAVSYPAGEDFPACSSQDRFTFADTPLSASLLITGDGTWELSVSNVEVGPNSGVVGTPACERAWYDVKEPSQLVTTIGGTYPLQDNDPDPNRFVAVATFDVPGWDTSSLTVSVDSAPTATPVARAGKCKKASKRVVKYRTYTNMPAAPEFHWYTTTVTVNRCRKKGKDYITGVKAKRHVEKGPVPRLMEFFFGWSTRTGTPIRYSPSKFPKSGTTSATARLQYTACFDLTTLLDKAGLRKYAKKKMKRPLRKAIKKVLQKANVDKITPQVRKSIAKNWNRKVDHAFRKGTIATYIRDKYRIPKSIGKYIEKAAQWPLGKAKRLLKNEVNYALSSGKYDGLTATLASEAILDGGYRALDELITYCGPRPKGPSFFTTWDVSFDVLGGRKRLRVSPDNYYLHPMMRVRRD